MLVAARLRHIAGTKWSTRRYLDMSRLRELRKADAADGVTADGAAVAEPQAATAG